MTLPLAVDPARVSIALVGRGAQVSRRLAWLQAQGAGDVTVYSDGPSGRLAAAAHVRRRLPSGGDLAGMRLVFVAGLTRAEGASIAAQARAAGALVNVEDQREDCDFHVPAVVRRGDLAVAIATGGRSPALARRLRQALEAALPHAWAGRLDELAALRSGLRAAGTAPPEVTRATERTIDAAGWLPAARAPEPALPP